MTGTGIVGSFKRGQAASSKYRGPINRWPPKVYKSQRNTPKHGLGYLIVAYLPRHSSIEDVTRHNTSPYLSRWDRLSTVSNYGWHRVCLVTYQHVSVKVGWLRTGVFPQEEKSKLKRHHLRIFTGLMIVLLYLTTKCIETPLCSRDVRDSDISVK